ncbi:MAG: T9SS type A sorting domain-containing protein [Saprospirales bacterium]|nr:T9SS type A sorting domain-containing protein [Saprospirales bacterium]
MKKGIYTLLLSSLISYSLLPEAAAQVQCDDEAEFFYNQSSYCQSDPNPVITINGNSGVFSFSVISGGPTLALNSNSGAIDLSGSDPGTYQVTNTVAGGGGGGDLVITGVIDGPITGGLPKAVEFYAQVAIPDLSIYGFGSANNGGGTDGQEFTFPAVAVAAGTHIWVATESTAFTAFFGFPPTYVNANAPNINGDDAIELFKNGAVIDVFGDINLSGNGQPWDYLDGWAYRVNQTGPDGSTFVLANWFFSGINALDGATSNANANPPFPIGTYSFNSQTQTFICHTNITVFEPLVIEAGNDQIACGGGSLTLNAQGAGTWSGGAGTFSNINSPSSTYTPAASEIGTTVALTWTVDPGASPCVGGSDVVLLTFLHEADAEFSYEDNLYCPNFGLISPTHITGEDGIYTYSVVSGGPTLSLNPQTGVINTNTSNQGTYQVTNTVSGCGNLVISGIIDGPVTGGLPKAVEFTAVENIPDLSVYGFGSANNGGGTDGIEFVFPADAISQGTSIWVATESAVFQTFFGFPPTYVANLAASINGDDAIELFCNGQVIDVFGEINLSGTGQPWEYMDGWAYRNNSTGPDGPGFAIGNWFFSGINALDGAPNNAAANPPFPIGTYFSTVGGVCADDVHTQTITIDDTEAPVIDCPADIVINLDPGACEATVNYNISATDNCDPDPVIVQTLGCPCFEFDIDEHVVEFEATDIYGNTSTCSFTVTVLEYPNPISTLTCDDLVQISLDPMGLAVIGADDILEGGPYGCYDDYIVNILNDFGFPIGNSANCSFIGQVWDIQVMDPDTGNKCWGTVVFEDKLGPTLLCNDVLINCTQDYNTVPFPLAFDNCDFLPEVELIGQVVDDALLCDEGYVTVLRTFIAFDEYDNESEICTQTITIQRPATVDFPDDIEWECDEYAQYPNITGGTPLTGSLSTTGSGIPGGLDGQYCQYGYVYADEILEICGSSFKIVRTWTVLDWCTGQIVTFSQNEDNIQIIKVLDTTPPVITLAPYSVNANITGVHPQPCTSTGFLQAAEISDNCNSWTVRIFTPVGEAVYVNGIDGALGGFIPAPGLGLGTYNILYQAIDECSNVAELNVLVQVIDGIVPTAICDEITDVNLTADGLAIVYAETFDDGSYDNCCLDHFEVRRMDGTCDGNFDNFGPTVEFCCADAGTTVMVVFRAIDCFGNFNDCMVEVNVNDKLPPVLLSCPQGQTITCEQYLQNYAAGIAAGNYSVLDGFGAPNFFDNCEFDLNHTVTLNLNNCTEGTITRSWTASDTNGQATCTQTITVTHVSNWVVEFPEDFTGECIDGQLPDTGEPEIFFDDCELIGVSHEDQIFTIVPDACYKIERTWEVINWCLYDDFGYDAYLETGKAECNLNIDWDGDGDKDCRTFRDGWNSTGNPGTPDGYIIWKQIIKVIDEEAPDFTVAEIDGCIVDTDCDMDLTLPYPDINDDCSLHFDVDITGDLGTFNNITADVVVPEVGPGEYEINYSVMDNCGNTSYQTITVVVEDCKKPTPYCKNGLVIEIMQTGMVEAWASDFDAGSFDNCGPVQLSFSPDVLDINQIYTCDDLGQQVVTLWITDESGNQDYCETFLIVQDNLNSCNNATVAIGGNISTEESEPVDGVAVEVNGGTFSTFTDNAGLFNLAVPEGGDYSVAALHDVAPSNGVTTWDLVLISRHILDVQPLTSPYKIIAADANHNESVTTLDMVAIRKVILQLEDHFPNNTSWRFVDKDFVFPTPTFPFLSPFPEVINFNNLATDQLFADFVAIKVGDVNSSAATLQDGEADERTIEGTMPIHVEDLEMAAGKTYRVDFRAQEMALYGFQFTLNFDPGMLEFVEMIPGLAGEEHFGFALLEEGAITSSWNRAEAVQLGEGDVLFSLVWKAKKAGLLSGALALNSRFTSAEAYDPQSGRLNIDLNFDNKKESTTFGLYQNAPNPFTGATTIGFHLPEAATATITVMDLSGKVLKLVRGEFAKGYQEIQLKDLTTAGVYYYRLDTPGFTATRKMVVQ